MYIYNTIMIKLKLSTIYELDQKYKTRNEIYIERHEKAIFKKYLLIKEMNF